MTAKREPDTIETIADVISQLEHHRQTHTEWAEYFERNPGVDPGELGDSAFHRAVEGRYTQMIEVLWHVTTGGHGAMNWQSIETAPRDGTSILVHNNDAPGLPTGVADKCWAGNTAVAAWWADEDDGNGAWICYMSMVRDPDLHFEPTHWMPMPLPPASTGSSGENDG